MHRFRAVTALNCHVIELKEEPDIEVEVTIDDNAEGMELTEASVYFFRFQYDKQILHGECNDFFAQRERSAHQWLN